MEEKYPRYYQIDVPQGPIKTLSGALADAAEIRRTHNPGNAKLAPIIRVPSADEIADTFPEEWCSEP